MIAKDKPEELEAMIRVIDYLMKRRRERLKREARGIRPSPQDPE